MALITFSLLERRMSWLAIVLLYVWMCVCVCAYAQCKYVQRKQQREARAGGFVCMCVRYIGLRCVLLWKRKDTLHAHTSTRFTIHTYNTWLCAASESENDTSENDKKKRIRSVRLVSFWHLFVVQFACRSPQTVSGSQSHVLNKRKENSTNIYKFARLSRTQSLNRICFCACAVLRFGVSSVLFWLL